MMVAPRFGNVARAQFNDGEEYVLEVREQRSSKSHGHYFASVKAAWENLTGETLEHLSTPDVLRGWCLVQSGWYDQHIVLAASKEDAMRMAMFARSLAKSEGYVEIVVVKVDGEWFVRSREPRSQSRASMNKEDFEKSKRDVLDILSGTISVTRKSLEREGRTGDHQ